MRLRSLLIFLLPGLVICSSGCGGPPAMESDEAFFVSDALYTAITSRRQELLNKSEADLKKLSYSGKLSAEAYQSLYSIILQARSGKWQDAAEELDGFIRNQPPR